MEFDVTNELVLEIFRLNGALLTAGNKLVSSVGLTSARWQVLGAIALSVVPVTVPQVARNMGLTRQSVQRLVNELLKSGLLALEPNPHHRRANVVVLTGLGNKAYQTAMDLEEPWIKRCTEELTEGQVTSALDTLRCLRRKLEQET